MHSRLLALRTRIYEFECNYQRQPGSVQLIAASKTRTVSEVEEAFHLGQTAFGENYTQEAIQKMALLAKEPIEWHFIGPMQTNKTKKIAEHFSWVQSVNDIHIAKRLHEQRPTHLPPINICIEVNISNEPTKHGVAMEGVWPLADYCMQFPHLNLRGLMAIPKPLTNFDDQRREFHKLFVLYQKLRDQGYPLDTLSMGMTHDYEAAIAEGSTMIRIGTAIFGERDEK